MLKIGKIFIQTENNKSKLCSRISEPGRDYLMWYEVDGKYEQYLCWERADAFLVCLLPYAMKKGWNITLETPVSEDLYYKLTQIFIPTLSKNCKGYLPVQIACETDAGTLPSAHGVGTGISCGVDSLYTLQNHTNLTEEKYNITHLTFFNTGSHGCYGGEKARTLFLERAAQVKRFAEEYQYEMILVDSNVSEFLNMSFVTTHTFRNCSAVFALQKLFGIYYYSTGYSIREFQLSNQDTAYYDLLSLYCFSTQNLALITAGGEAGRNEKLENISAYPPSHRYLNVCFRSAEKNCMLCEKCRRTVLGLYSIGRLEIYREVFDVPYFYEHKNDMLGYLLAKKKDDKYREILRQMKKSEIKIPILAHGKGVFYRFKFGVEAMREAVCTNQKLRTFYHKYIKRKQA